MKPQEIAITPKGKGGMSSKNISEVLAVLRRAVAQHKLPSMTFEYNKHPLIFGVDPLYLTPKNASLSRSAVKVRTVIRTAFGNKYSVHLS